MVHLFGKYKSNIWQFIKFSLIGVANTLFSYVIYSMLIFWSIDYLVGNIAGFVVGVLNSYYWNNKYVFAKQEGENRSDLKALIKVFTSYGFTGLILSSILLVFWIDILGISEYLAPIINLFITVPLNFILNKLWAFKREKSKL